MTTHPRHDSDTANAVALERELGAGQERIVDLLALAMAVQRDSALRATLAGSVGGSRFALALNRGGPHLIVDEHGVVDTAIASPPPTGVPRIEWWSIGSVPSSFEHAHRTARLEAERIMRAMSQDSDSFQRAAFAKAARWASVVANDAYRQTALLSMIFDVVRRRIVDDPQPEALRAYWVGAHLLGHLTMLAAAAEPSHWLAAMANTFAWRSWTPSFPLVRERMSRLAVRGAWAAARFGPTMVERYLPKLGAPQLLRVFDAVLALVAIASAHDRDREPIERELFARLRHRIDQPTTSDAERLVLEALERSASRALHEPDAAARAVARPQSGASLDERLAVAVATDHDAAEIDEHGDFPCILAIARLATAPATLFFPAAVAAGAQRWRPRRALEALNRTLAHRVTEWN